MASDSIPNAPSTFPISSANPKDFAKKKRANRSAKLKQCKLDARREQWLSQVKNKGCKGEASGKGGTVDVGRERGKAIVNLEINPRAEPENEGFINNYGSDTESPANSPTSHSSSVLGSNDSGTNFTGSSSRSSISSSSGRCCVGSMSGQEDEEGDDECLEDWEAFADALAATEEKQEPDIDILDSPQENNEVVSRMGSCSDVKNHMLSGADISQKKQESGVNGQMETVSNGHAWRPDDAFRPECLPNLSKQFIFPMETDRHFGIGGKAWDHNTVSDLTSCPICTEDFDATDTSFLPCLCGFRICLFCYNRILEYNDGRCPGCRKPYLCAS